MFEKSRLTCQVAVDLQNILAIHFELAAGRGRDYVTGEDRIRVHEKLAAPC